MADPHPWRTTSAALARILFIGLVATVLIELSFSFWDRSYSWYLTSTPQENVFFYEEVGLVEEQEGGLRMYSIASRRAEVDRVVWSDRLRCGPDRRITATQQTSAEQPAATPLDRTEWDFFAPMVGLWSSPEECIMESVITVEKAGAHWSQQVESEPFLIGGGSR